MPTIKKALDGKNPEKIYVVNGPGSFTGVRLGVTIAKTFAYTLEIPIKTISSLELKAVSLVEKNKIVGVKENNGYYIGIFDEDNNLMRRREGDYNAHGQLTSLYEYYTPAQSIRTDIGYDEYGNLESITNAKGIKQSYIYDSENHQFCEKIVTKG